MDDSIDARAVLLHGLADRSRLALVEQLAGGGRRVSDVVEASGLTQTHVSRHLACLYGRARDGVPALRRAGGTARGGVMEAAGLTLARKLDLHRRALRLEYSTVTWT